MQGRSYRVKEGRHAMATIQEKSAEMREKLVEGIVALMEKDGLRWSQGFDPVMLMPRNGVSGGLYRGVNRLSLAYRAMSESWEDPRWATAHQAFQKGWKIKKGAKASIVEKWASGSFVKEKEHEGETTLEKVSYVKLQRIFYVFNFGQLEGPEPYMPPAGNDAEYELVGRLIASSPCEVVEAAVQAACYQLDRDRIVMPPREVFDSPLSCVQTLTHEMCHGSGHRSRLDREDRMRAPFGSRLYAEEELRAEFAAAFLCAHLHVGYESSHMEGHAAYLKSWLEAVKEDRKAMLDAIVEAEGIADYLIAVLDAKDFGARLCA